MGVCAQQHRVSTGKYNSILFKVCDKSNVKMGEFMSAGRSLMISSPFMGLILYMYIILLCLLMALFIDISLKKDSLPSTSETNPIFFRTNSHGDILNICFFIIIYNLPKLFQRKFSPTFLKVNIKKHFCHITNCVLYTFWVATLNLILIII